MVKKTVCIIGAGASGITCIKEARESGFDIVCYEKGSYVGGLWHYHDNDEDGIASVMYSTIINSSKEMSAYSDFPPPKQLPNYMHNSQMIKYLESYAEKHEVAQYVRFHHEVVKVKPAPDYAVTGRWSVRVRKTKESNVEEETIFDAVMICTGHHVKPMIPKFKGQENFKGQVIHTHSYKKPKGFEDKSVVVVGVGNSGGDAAAELSSIGKQVYWSTRRGVWMLYRVGPNGEPFDSCYLRRYWDYINKLTPYSLTCSMIEHLMNQRFDHEKYGLKPAHRIMGQHPMVNDALPNRILSGTVQVKTNIDQFTENGVIFEGESKITPVDAVILATGYEVHFPFLDQDILWTEDNKVELYKYMFNPRLEHPETLSFIGLIQAVGPAIPISEMQARWHCHLLQGKSKLPGIEKMMRDIDVKRKEIESRYFEGPRHTMQIDWIPFLDELASQFGARPNMAKLAITDPKLWYHLMFGPSFPYQYRLVGPGKWKGAREAIIYGQERIDAAFETRSSKKKGIANGHASSSGSKGKRTPTTGEQLIDLLFVLLSFVPHLLRGAKWASVVLLLLFVAGKLFPATMATLIPFL